MKFHKCLKLAINMVIHSKLRSWLTIIGIVIGVASVIAIIAMSDGMEAEINSRLSGLGADIITVTAGYSRAQGMFGGGDRDGGFGDRGGATASSEEIQLTRTDLQALKGIPELEIILTNIRGNADIYYVGENGSVSVTGVDQKVWSQITTEEIAEGRMLGPADQNVVVIGASLAEGYFENQVGINKILTINDRAFRVVGILDGEGRGVYMPISAAYDVLEDKERDVYDSITIKVKEDVDIDTAVEKITNKLMLVRHVTDQDRDFSVSSMKQTMETINSSMQTMTIFLTAIAAIALLVGAIGIANTMFTSVLEKTKQIGIMKAIGARNKDILLLFLLNAGIIGLIGGALGILLGIGLSNVFTGMISIGRMTSGGAIIRPEVVIIALGVSMAVGMISGLIPAYQASKLKPVDALRYE